MAVAPAGYGQALDRDLSAALAAVPHAKTQVGACVVDLRDGTLVFERGADDPLIPASTMKLFAMVVALEVLGADFQFETVLATDGSNLIVIGDGDPAIGDDRLCRERGETTTSVFERWAEALRAQGFSEFSGDLILDESVFDDERIHPTWEAGDLGKWYAAPVGGLNFNDNCVDLTVYPGERVGSPVSVAVQPPNSLVQIVNRCTTGEGTPILHHPPGTMEYRISGRCGKTWPFGSVAFPDPGLLFADSLRTVLSNRGVSIRGSIRRSPEGVRGKRLREFRLARTTSVEDRVLSGVSDDGAGAGDGLQVVAVARTPIADVLQRAGKNSQNLFAECLLKRAGFEWARRRGSADASGSFALGAAAVVDMVDRARIGRTGLRVVDGSGLSRENAASARQLTQLLVWSHRQPWGSMLHDQLAVAGVDGSLGKRIKDLPNRIHAKTGTMRGVRALSGYVDDQRGPRYAFTILFNGYHGPSTPYKNIQDRVCRILAEAAE